MAKRSEGRQRESSKQAAQRKHAGPLSVVLALCVTLRSSARPIRPSFSTLRTFCCRSFKPMTTELRSRKSAAAAAAEKIVPLDSSEQAKIIRDFQIEKMQQDTMWKHALAVLYGVGGLLLTLILACSIIAGCDPPRQSELEGPAGCTLFNLPSSLWRATHSAALVNCILLVALLTVASWASYALSLDWTGAKLRFNETQAQRSAAAQAPLRAEEESKEEQEARASLIAGAKTNQPPLPIGAMERTRLRWLQRTAHASLVVWLIVSASLLSFHRDSSGLGLLVWLLIAGPLALVALTKLAARWSAELEGQIEELQKSQYSFHEL